MQNALIDVAKRSEPVMAEFLTWCWQNLPIWAFTWLMFFVALAVFVLRRKDDRPRRRYSIRIDTW